MFFQLEFSYYYYYYYYCYLKTKLLEDYGSAELAYQRVMCQIMYKTITSNA